MNLDKMSARGVLTIVAMIIIAAFIAEGVIRTVLGG